MAFTYGDILRAARDGSAFFDATRVPGGPAVRLASDIQRDLVAKAAKRDPERLSTTTTLSSATVNAALAVAATPPAPVALPAFLRVIRMKATLTTAQPQTLIAITPDEQRDYEYDRAWFLTGGQAYFTGYASDWSDVQSVIVTYIPAVVDFVAETDALVLPDDAKWAFVARLAYAFALRVNGMPTSTEVQGAPPIQLDASAFSATAEKAESLWLAQLTDQRRITSRHPIRGEYYK